MLKNETSKEFIEELDLTNKVEILNDVETEEYHRIIAKCEDSLSGMTKALKDAGYSEFVLGAFAGMMLATQSKSKLKKVSLWSKYKPELFKWGKNGKR